MYQFSNQKATARSNSKRKQRIELMVDFSQINENISQENDLDRFADKISFFSTQINQNASSREDNLDQFQFSLPFKIELNIDPLAYESADERNGHPIKYKLPIEIEPNNDSRQFNYRQITEESIENELVCYESFFYVNEDLENSFEFSKPIEIQSANDETIKIESIKPPEAKKKCQFVNFTANLNPQIEAKREKRNKFNLNIPKILNKMNYFNSLEIFKLIEYFKVNIYRSLSGFRINWSDFETYELNAERSLSSIEGKSYRIKLIENYLPRKYIDNAPNSSELNARKKRLKIKYIELYRELNKFNFKGTFVKNENSNFCDLQIHNVIYSIDDFYRLWKQACKDQICKSIASEEFDYKIEAIEIETESNFSQKKQINSINPKKLTTKRSPKLSDDSITQKPTSPIRNDHFRLQIQSLYSSFKELLKDICSINLISERKEFTDQILTVNTSVKDFLQQIDAIGTKSKSNLTLHFKLLNSLFKQLVQQIESMKTIEAINQLPEKIEFKRTTFKNQLYNLSQKIRFDSLSQLLTDTDDLNLLKFYRMYQLFSLFLINQIINSLTNQP